MSRLLHTLEKIASLLTKYIGLIIICFSVLAFFWRDGFAWTTNYTSVFLGVAMFGMGLTIHIGDFKVVFTRPKEVILGFIAQYTLMPVIAWLLATAFHLPADLALGVILVGCCPGGTASNVITYIAGGDVALSVGMTIASTLAAPLMTPLLVYLLAGAWVKVSFFSMVISVVKVVLIPVSVLLFRWPVYRLLSAYCSLLLPRSLPRTGYPAHLPYQIFFQADLPPLSFLQQMPHLKCMPVSENAGSVFRIVLSDP